LLHWRLLSAKLNVVAYCIQSGLSCSCSFVTAGATGGDPRPSQRQYFGVSSSELSVGIEIARDGALLVAGDVGNTVWRVRASR
jgi:glucose/arabinose dehydrogenase